MTEQWKAIPGQEGYEVSDRGRVRSYWKRAGRRYALASNPQRILKTSRRAQRYHSVCLSGKRIPVHRLVMLAFVGPCPDGLIVCHNDDDPNNNTLENLRYDTHASNSADAVEAGSFPGQWKIDDDDAFIIRQLIDEGAPRRILADIYDVALGTINQTYYLTLHKPKTMIDRFLEEINGN